MKSEMKRGKPGGQGPRIGHLDTLTGILQEMGCVYREMRTNKTPTADGTKLIYSLRCMRDVIETIAVERIEKRLDEMAEQIAQRGTERSTGHGRAIELIASRIPH
jgi:hypothetical protein